MGVGTLQRHFINLGGGLANLGAIRWGFRAPKDTYKNVAAGLGVNLVDDTNRTGIVYGANQPRPVRVRVMYKAANAGGGTGNDVARGVRRFCEPDKLNEVLFGSLNGQKIFVVDMDDGGGTEYDIDNVTIA